MPVGRTDTQPLLLPTFDQFWADAAQRHNLRLPPSSGDVAGCKSIDDVIDILEKEENARRAFREKGQKIRDFIAPFASFTGHFIDVGAEAAATAGVPGGQAVFAVFRVLLAATKSVSQVYDALEELLSKLQSFLRRLDTYITSPAVISLELKGILVKILVQLLDVLALFTKYLDKNVHRVRRFVPRRAEHYVKMLIGNTEVQDALKKLDKLTSEEQQRSIAEVLVATKTTARDVAELHEELCGSNLRKLELCNMLLYYLLVAFGITKWLSPPNAEDNHHLISKARQQEAGDWFFGSQFAAWKDTKNSVFWVHGKPGSGKSVLFSSIVDRLKLEQEPAYFYFDFRDLAKQTVRGLVASLLFQLASHSLECFGLLQQFYAKNHASLSPPNDDKLFDCLTAMLRASRKVYILVDALDECPEGKRHKELFPFLKKIVTLNHAEIHLLVTSRPEADVQKFMAPIVTAQLNLHDVHDQASALARHVTYRLANIEDYPDWSEDMKSQAREILISKAGGMFLWADLQLESLRHCRPIAVKKALSMMPMSLYDIYERILAGINIVNASLALRVFECIAFAAHPLTPAELAEVFALDLELENAVLRPEYRTAEPESSLLRTCSSLVQIVTGSSSGNDARLVQFVHFSAQEYLLSARLPDRVAIYGLSPESAHTTLAKLCLTVLNSPSSFQSQPFANYAVCNWTEHVKPCSVQVAVDVPLAQFLHPDSPYFSRWLKEWTARPDSGIHLKHPYDVHSTPLYVATFLGLYNHVRVLLSTPGIDINAAHSPVVCAAAMSKNIEVTRLVLEHGANVNGYLTGNWTSLHMVAQNGHLEIARLLLEQGAVVDARNKHGWAPLHVAALNGRLDIAGLLLECGAVVDARQNDKGTPLHVATYNGYLEIVRLLLGRGATVNARAKDEWTPLHVVAQNGHLQVAHLLLDRGASVDVRHNGGGTPLHVAAKNGHLEVARLLLEQGSVVDARELSECTPLHVTAQDGHLEVARLLLERGAAVDARTEDGSTSLHAAAQNGHLEIVCLLLEQGAAVDALHNDRWTPLHLAAQNGHLGVVCLLLEQGAAVNAHTKREWTPLHLAAKNGHLKVTRLLLDRGAAIDARYSDKGTSLHAAVQLGHLEVVRLLLEHGAVVDARNKYEFVPLHMAVWHGHIDIARLLLEHGAGADIDTGQEYKYSSLHLAALKKRLDIARLLVEHGATIDSRNRGQKTPLYTAASKGSVDVVRYLLNRKAAIEARTSCGWTVLHGAATLNADVDVVKFLLEHGANIEEKNYAGRTALLCAAGEGHDAVVGVLLEHGANMAACDQLGFGPLDYAAAGGHAAVVRLLLERGVNTRSENAPHGPCTSIAGKACSADAVRPVNMTWRLGEAQDVVRLLQEARPVVTRGDMVLRRLRKFRSVGSWGDTWTEVKEIGDSSAARQ